MGTYYDHPTTQKVACNCRVSGIQRPLGRQLRSIADCLKLAALRQCRQQFARRKPAIERGGTRPQSFELDEDLDGRLLADERQEFTSLRRTGCDI